RDRAVAADSATRLAGMQQRSFATTDRYLLVRAVTTTLLSSGYAIAYTAPAADTIRASKDSLQVTITIAPHASSELRVRVEARTGTPPRDVDDPAYYEQDFFAPLSKTLELPARPAQ
ncbi:MAG: hypothetical protein ACYC1L_17530, partial [Alphaproteobacteria bacterium]